MADGLMIGIELHDSAAVAVAVDDDGRVLKRAAIDAKPDLTAAAIAAIEQLQPGASDAIGLASAMPEAPSVVLAAAAVAKRFPHTTAPHTSGVAAAVAEAWVGIARGFKD